MRISFPLLFLCCALLSACAKRNEWEDLNYSSVYRYYKQREYDAGYVPPPSIGCFDEDLYNCR